jgi:hypothetical protein
MTDSPEKPTEWEYSKYLFSYDFPEGQVREEEKSVDKETVHHSDKEAMEMSVLERLARRFANWAATPLADELGTSSKRRYNTKGNLVEYSITEYVMGTEVGITATIRGRSPEERTAKVEVTLVSNKGEELGDLVKGFTAHLSKEPHYSVITERK